VRLAENPHDLRLPAWGPYTKRYIGISHIPDVRRGLRFDLSVFPGFYRRRVDVPSVLWESGYHPWEAAPDLRYFCHRHELEWKDQVYCDISFSEIDADTRLIRCECVNATDRPQSIVLHYVASMHFPSLRPNSPEAIRPCRVELPAGAVWIDALDYADLRYAHPRPTDNLMPDGLYRGEVRDHGFVQGSGVGRGFGRDPGDAVVYRVTIRRAISDTVLLFRYRLAEGETARFAAGGLVRGEIAFAGGEGFQTLTLPAGDLSPGEHTLRLVSTGGAEIELDGFAIVPAGEVDTVRFRPVVWHPHPGISSGPIPNSLILRYPDVDRVYGLAWGFDRFQVREFHSDELDRLMRYTVHNHVATAFRGAGDGHFTDVFLRPIPLAPHRARVIYGVVCVGEVEDVRRRLAGFERDPEEYESVYRAARERVVDLAPNPEGERYRFGQERMAATLLTNVVYPVYIRRSYIRHNTPGRWWDSLYTWDSGFIGIGLAELDLDRAIDCLNAYVTEPGDPHAAFVHHGSPVPVQIYLFLELWNRTQSEELLRYFYPRLRQYHEFLCGNLGSSTTRRLRSNLIQTWDYFYNSGGWDDYPPQVYVHEHGLEPFVAPVMNTAHCIRTAKILRMAAEARLPQDVREYEGEIAMFTEALQAYAWDGESGYFGYVRHDEDGRPVGILRHESSPNFNMGLDGAYPLVAGICTEAQEARLLSYLTSDQHLWTSIGITAVDQSAPYYRVDGYWNGTVWMPHQWFFWKTMLDLGRLDVAACIARTALDLWQGEVETSYHCFEHFVVESGRGAGWHQFGGLSAPVLSWFGAYHRPGRLTAGFDVWVTRLEVDEGHRALDATLRLYGRSDRRPGVLVTMDPDGAYRVTWDDAPVRAQRISPGVLAITLPTASGEGTLRVRPEGRS